MLAYLSVPAVSQSYIDYKKKKKGYRMLIMYIKTHKYIIDINK